MTKKTEKWKKEIRRLARDFYVNPNEVIKYVEANASGSESDDVLYIRAHRKLMALAFGD